MVIISYFYIQQIATFIGLNLNNQSLSIIKSLYFAYVIFHLSYSIKCIFYAAGCFKKTLLISILINFCIYFPYCFLVIDNIDFLIKIFSIGVCLNFIISSVFLVFFIKANMNNKNVKIAG